jgi:hemoglobin
MSRGHLRFLPVLALFLLAAIALQAVTVQEDVPRTIKTADLDRQVLDVVRPGKPGNAVSTGALLFRRSPSACFRVYEGSLLTLRPLLGHHPELQKSIDDGLAEANGTQDFGRRVRILRGVFKTIEDRLGAALVKAPDEKKEIAKPELPETPSKVTRPTKPGDKKTAEEKDEVPEIPLKKTKATAPGEKKTAGKKTEEEKDDVPEIPLKKTKATAPGEKKTAGKKTEEEKDDVPEIPLKKTKTTDPGEKKTAGKKTEEKKTDLPETPTKETKSAELVKKKAIEKKSETPEPLAKATKPTVPEKPQPVPSTLWQRLGDETGVRRLVDLWFALASTDPKVDFTRGGKYKVNEAELKAKLVAFISRVSQGPLDYKGKGMKEAHQGMGIANAEFDAFVSDLKKVLTNRGIKEAEISDLVKEIESTRKDIVEAVKPGEKKSAPATPDLKKG